MPKVIQINSVANYGSTGKIMESIGLLAKELGWSSKIAFGGRYSRPSQLESYQISTINQSRLSAVHSLLTDRHGFANKKETLAFVGWLRKERPDIVHLHNIHSYVLNVRILFNFLKDNNIPTIWTLHDCWAFTGHCSHFIRNNCYKWLYGCNTCPASKAFPKSLFIDRSANNYFEKKSLFTSVSKMQIITVSDWLRKCAESSFLGKYPIRVIPNGIDIDLFRPQTLGIDELKKHFDLHGKKIILGVSMNWCKAKGLDDFIHLRKLLPMEYSLVLIGMTSSQVKSYKSPGLLCLPKTSKIEELVNWYNAADVVLNLSYAETFGLPIAEGLSCGTPAVVYDNTALTELLTSDTGAKVPTGDINAVVEAIKYVLASSHITSSACRKRAEMLYDKRRNYANYISLYESLL